MLLAAALWLAAGAALVLLSPGMIYPFQPGFPADRPQGLPSARAAVIAAADGTPLTVWLKPPPPGGSVVIYFTGNGGMLAAHAPLLAALARQGLGIAALNYRGAGGMPGNPSQEALTADAVALYDSLDTLLGAPLPAGRRVLFGTSLGAALAVQLAARRPVAALILESPFSRLCEVARFHYPLFPACQMLPWEHWDSAALIGTLELPLLVVHGEADEIVPVALARKLFDAAPGPKRMATFPGIGHNRLPPDAVAGLAADFLARPDG